ncbi:patatin family protein [Pseudonocardia ailaonensis]|uniref:Patatin family protein n=1 Tax=Pseudonocardia ailaonensis TaxID=367279 RepID=A0ABN2NN46_9PSEU
MSEVPGVLEVLAARRAGERDEHVVALAVEGGGMRGIVSAAMLLALRDLGLIGTFDRLYGTSSGAINLAYLAAGAGWDAVAIYYDHLVRGFVRRLPRPGRPVLDMVRVERILRRDAPLDVPAALASPLDVRMVLTDVDDRRPVAVGTREAGDHLVEHLLAGAWLPILAGRPYRFGGRAYLDGGLLRPDALYAAAADGATHVLMLSTSTADKAAALPGPTTQLLTRVLDAWSPGLGAEFRAANRRWRTDSAVLTPGRPVRLDGVEVRRVRPAARAHRVERLTRDRALLLDGARVGYATVMETFGRPLGGHFAVV